MFAGLFTGWRRLRLSPDAIANIETECTPNDDGAPNEMSCQAGELIKKTHVYLGHSSQTQFLRILRSAGAATEVLAFAGHRFHCPFCSSTSRLAVHREAAVPITYEFNNIVAMDLFILDFSTATASSLAVEFPIERRKAHGSRFPKAG